MHLQSVTFESPDPERDAAFWASVLGRSPVEDSGGILLPGSPRQLGLCFTIGPAHGKEDNRLHLHLSEDARNQWESIDACRAAGGRLKGNGHVPKDSYAVMADPVNDEFCVIEDGNKYLDGCGPLGEVTCAGSPRVGHFWSEVLGWPLVWEQGEETAIQSPAGGTKLAWSGEWSGPVIGGDRQYFVLTVDSDEFGGEVERLLALGASARDRTDARDEVGFSDPAGMRFVLRQRP